MFQQDFLIRQAQQLAAVLAQVLFRKRTGEVEQAQSVLEAEIARVFGTDLEGVRGLDRRRLRELCTSGERLAGEVGVAVAALLSEDEGAEGRRRALWLYEIALEAGDAVPFDVHDRIDALRVSLA
ncbi:hypothetical protein [Rubrivirga sp.]|uniref:hypothetical protein n=1 Tax=Rubrivirga sp. TaxID=1885344 RepID=UPI003C742B66